MNITGAELKTVILKDLNSVHLMQLATATNNQPWCVSLYFVQDSSLNLYWASLPTRKHSRDIKINNNVAIAVAFKFVKGEKVIGLQGRGRASSLENVKEIKSVATLYAAKFQRSKQWVQDIASGRTEHRLYKFRPSEYRLFDEVNFPIGQILKLDI